jgi:DNA-binding transcriptional ArsR family regulator
MKSSRNELFNAELREDAGFYKALAHPARLAIIRFLAEQKVCMTGDIAQELPLSRTTVKQHLTELKKASLIKGEIEGVKVNYCLNMEKLGEMKQRIDGMFDALQECC